MSTPPRKKARAATAVKAGAPAIPSTSPLLTSACIVGRYCLLEGCGELPHVTRRIDAFLDVFSAKWMLAESYKQTGSLRLLQYIAARGTKASVGVDPFYRRWLFHGATELAAKRGDLEALRLLMEVDLPNEFLTKAVAAAAANGHLHILEWLYEEHRDRGYWGSAEMCGAMKNHHDDVVAWLRTHAVPHKDSAREVIQAAASAGYLDVVQWLHRERRVDATGCLASAVSNSRWETARWLLENCDKKRKSLDRAPAIRDGELSFLKLLLSRNIRNTSHYSLEAAAGSGDMEILKWFHCEHHVPFRVEAVKRAAESGNLDVIKWFHEAGCKTFDASVMDGAAKDGHLEVVQWFHTTRTEGCTTAAMDGAARNGHLEIVKWLHAERKEGCTREAMDGAATGGFLGVVQWLHEHRKEGCTTSAMDGAAGSGHLEVVKWLHAHRSEGCTTSAMDGAAVKGHLDVVKWLHESRKEGCTVRAMNMNFLSSENCLEVVKFLHANRTEGCTTDAMDNAAENGHLEIVKFLHENRTEGCTRRAMGGAIAHAHFDVAMFLHTHRSEGFDFRHTIMNDLDKSFDLTQWMFENYAEMMDGEVIGVPKSNWRFNQWCRQINLQPERGDGVSAWWRCELRALRRGRRQW